MKSTPPLSFYYNRSLPERRKEQLKHWYPEFIQPVKGMGRGKDIRYIVVPAGEAFPTTQSVKF